MEVTIHFYGRCCGKENLSTDWDDREQLIEGAWIMPDAWMVKNVFTCGRFAR